MIELMLNYDRCFIRYYPELRHSRELLDMVNDCPIWRELFQ